MRTGRALLLKSKLLSLTNVDVGAFYDYHSPFRSQTTLVIVDDATFAKSVTQILTVVGRYGTF